MQCEEEVHQERIKIILLYCQNKMTHFNHKMACSGVVSAEVRGRHARWNQADTWEWMTWLIEGLLFHHGGLRIPWIKDAGDPDLTPSIYERLWFHSCLRSRSRRLSGWSLRDSQTPLQQTFTGDRLIHVCSFKVIHSTAGSFTLDDVTI